MEENSAATDSNSNSQKDLFLQKRTSKRKNRDLDMSSGQSSATKETQADTVESVYNQTQQFIQQLDIQIKECKRYNEVKTYRRFEVMIKDLEREVESLKKKLKIEEDLRNPTKQYMREILDRLVEYQERSKKQTEEIDKISQTLKVKDEEIEKLKIVIIRMQNKSVASKVERLPSFQNLSRAMYVTNPSTNLSTASLLESQPKIFETVKKFLNSRQREHSNNGTKITKFEEMLGNIVGNIRNISIFKTWESLLSEIERWARQFEETPKLSESDAWRVKFMISKKLERLNMSSVKTSHHERSGQPSPLRVPKRGSVEEDVKMRMKTEANQMLVSRMKKHREFASTEG